MALHANGADLEPELSFFCHLDDVALPRTGVRYDIQVVLAEKSGPGSEDVLQPVRAACFFIGHKDKAKTQFRRNVALLQFFGQQQHACYGLLVVLHAAAVKHVALAPYLPRVGLPGRKIAGGDNVHVAEKPERTFCSARDAGNKIGPHT